ncbi:hypothetical protein BGZ60DRAFT_521877 [Tricladium varicosporioides]|nr:hypothetical protein BGZ60DRAFT_521877 [Hymenoscyphus varicosporioides]
MAQPRDIDEGKGPLERGRRQYQIKEYKKAISFFTEAIEMSSDNLLLTAWDHRAACYEKLHQYHPALKDAKRMIDLKPECSKGYLRCGKVLQLKGESELAMKIYERGLKKVKIGADNERALLQSIYNKMRLALDPGKTLDPLEFLPLELAQMVCQHLAMRDKVVCLAVSRSWKRLLESSHKLWTTLDTTTASKPISQNSLRAYVRRSNYTLERALITQKARLDTQKISYLTKHCKKLRHIDILGHGVIGDSLTTSVQLAKSLEIINVSKNCFITVSAIRDILKACKATLIEASFLRVKGNRTQWSVGWPRLDKLRALSLRADEQLLLDIAELVGATPNLRSVTLNNWKLPVIPSGLEAWAHLEYLDLGDSQMLLLPRLPPNLKHLILKDNPHLDLRVPRDHNEEVVNKLPFLETLDLSGTAFTGEGIKRLTQESIKLKNLQALSLGMRIVGTTGSVTEEYPSADSVTALSLRNLLMWEKRLLEVVSLYPNLTRLDVSGTKITGVAVKEFVKRGIKWLKLTDCREISTDAVEWARGQGVEVEYLFPSQTTSVKAFRDTSFTGAFWQ